MHQLKIEQDDTANVLLKGWETFQSLAKSNGESAWNLRAWGISVWSALMAYAYTSDKAQIIVIAIVLLVTIFLIELAIRQVQYQYIDKSVEIERCINSLLAGDILDLPEGGISTNIETPDIKHLFALLILRRWLIWFPYLILMIFSLIAFKLF